MDYNGGSVIAMVGKDCVAIASDLRLGNQALGVSSNFQRVCSICLFVYSVSFKLEHKDISCDRSYLSWTAWTWNGCNNIVSSGRIFLEKILISV